MPNNQNGAVTTHPKKAMILFIILAFGSVQSKTSLSLGDVAFVSLISLSVLSGFIVYFQDRISKVGPAGFELDQAIQEARKSEATVKELAAAILEMIVADADFQGNDTPSSERFKKALLELKRLSE